MPARSRQLCVLGYSHRSAPLELRERLSLPADRLEELHDRLHAIPDILESAILQTCNRMELYAVYPPQTPPEQVRDFLPQYHRLLPSCFQRFAFMHFNEVAVQHLFEVSAGIDSQMIGETEIFGQVKEAYQTAVRRKTAGPLLHKVFQKCFQAAKWVRTHTDIGQGQISIGNVAVELALRIFGDLRRAEVLLIGSGEVGTRTAQALRSRGARHLTVASRSPERAATLGLEVGAAPMALGEALGDLARFDIIIGATTTETPLISRTSAQEIMRQRPHRPLFLIDLAHPRNIAPAVAALANVFLYNLEDLAVIANENLMAREAEIEHCRHALQERAQQTWVGLNGTPRSWLRG